MDPSVRNSSLPFLLPVAEHQALEACFAKQLAVRWRTSMPARGRFHTKERPLRRPMETNGLPCA